MKDRLLLLIVFAGVMSISLASCSSQDQFLQALSRQALAEYGREEPYPPHEFISDGCSWWPDGDWVQCCVTHDVIYWAGGTREEREQADNEMSQCITKAGHPIMSRIMYYGVRMGGIYWLPTPYRWGFGWDYPQSGPPGKQY